IGGFPAVSGAPFGPFPLGFGTTSIEVVVTAEDGITTKTYTARVRRVPFALASTTVIDGAIWKANLEMVFTFNEDVDFTTVSLNTIEIRPDVGVPATGTFSLRDPRTIAFQPTCPTLDDLSDAGLIPGGVPY